MVVTTKENRRLRKRDLLKIFAFSFLFRNCKIVEYQDLPNFSGETINRTISIDEIPENLFLLQGGHGEIRTDGSAFTILSNDNFKSTPGDFSGRTSVNSHDYPFDDSSSDFSDFSDEEYTNENQQSTANSFYQDIIQSNEPSNESCSIDNFEYDIELDDSSSDVEEYEDEYLFEQDRKLYPNAQSVGYQVSKKGSYTRDVYNHKYKTTEERYQRFLKRQIRANKQEHLLFSQPRPQEEIDVAKTVQWLKNLKNKVYRHPEFFGLERPEYPDSEKAPKVRFLRENKEQIDKILQDHLQSQDTRTFAKGKYHNHNEEYEHYYNYKTGKIILVQVVTNDKNEKERFGLSFWDIEELQRMELFNSKHIHKHYNLVKQLDDRKQAFEEYKRLNTPLTEVQAARKASEEIIKRQNNENGEF